MPGLNRPFHNVRYNAGIFPARLRITSQLNSRLLSCLFERL